MKNRESHSGMHRIIMRLLLVDDDEILRYLVNDYLTRSGHEVDQATDGTSALSLVESQKYDALICDWEMPGMDGPALCRAIRAGTNGRDLYIIMLTGKDSPASEVDGFDSGVDAYLIKPCEPTDLFAALRTAQSIQQIHHRKVA